MPHPWDDTVRLGIIQFMAFPEFAAGDGAIADNASRLLDDGFFTCLEVGPVKNANERRRLKEAAGVRSSLLAFACQPLILSRKLNLNSLDPIKRAEAVKTLATAIEESRQFGASAVGLMSGPNVAPQERPAAIDALSASLAEICRAAPQFPVHLEVFDHDVDKKCLIGPTARAAELARRVRATESNFGLMLDLSHFPLQHERAPEALDTAREVLTHVHAGNCVLRDPSHPQFGDTHPRFGIPDGENGITELAGFLGHLLRIGYLRRGTPRMLSIEVKPAPGEDSWELVKHTRQTWESAWTQASLD